MQTARIGNQQVRVIVICLLAILAIVLFINAPAVRRQLDAWKLLPQPERLTELYFSDHTKLPTTYLPGTTQSFGFSVHNLEYRDTDYSYRVVQLSEDRNSQALLTGGGFSLKQDETKKVPLSIVPGYAGKRSQIEVQLINRQTTRQQSIHYLATSLISAEQYAAQNPEASL